GRVAGRVAGVLHRRPRGHRQLPVSAGARTGGRVRRRRPPRPDPRPHERGARRRGLAALRAARRAARQAGRADGAGASRDGRGGGGGRARPGHRRARRPRERRRRPRYLAARRVLRDDVRAHGERARDAGGRRGRARRFSTLAFRAVAAIVLAGLALTFAYVGGLAAFVGTAYGVMVLSKVALLVPALALAYVNMRAVRRASAAPGARLFSFVEVELG